METNTISTLKALNVSTIANNTVIFVKGYYNVGDGGGGNFYFNSTSTKADDFGIYIKPTTGSGAWHRIYDGSINIKWYGVIGDIPNSEIRINKAIETLNTEIGYGEIIFPYAFYKLDGDITTYVGITLKGIGNPYFFRRGTIPTTGNPTYFITINGSNNPVNWVHSKVTIEGIMFAGNESFTDSPPIFRQNFIALRIFANQFHINNCAFFGFDKTTKFESNSYLVSFNSCSFRQNNYGFHYDYTGLTNSGENIKILDSVICGNNVGVYNNLGGIFINNCSLDYNYQHIGQNISKIGGVLSLNMVLDNCHIESSVERTGGGFRIKNNGVLIVNNCTFIDNTNSIFENSDTLVLSNNSFVIGEGKYLVSGSGFVNENNTISIANDSIARVGIRNSGIKNGSFDFGTLAGWSLSEGTNASVSTNYRYDSNYSLQIKPTNSFTGTYLISDFINIPTNKKGYILTVFLTYSNHIGFINIHFYDKNKNAIGSETISFGSTTIATRLKAQNAFLPNAEFLQIEIRCQYGDSTKFIYLDDFYISYLVNY